MTFSNLSVEYCPCLKGALSEEVVEKLKKRSESAEAC